MPYAHTDDLSVLLGRDARALYKELVSACHEDDTLLAAELRAVEALVQFGSLKLAPTASRTHAIELLPAAAMLCRSEDEVAALLEQVRDWIDGLGNLRSRAKEVIAAKQRVTELLDPWGALRNPDDQAAVDSAYKVMENAGLVIRPTVDAIVCFRIYTETSLIAVLQVAGYQPVLAGVSDFGRDEPGRVPVRIPELSA